MRLFNGTRLTWVKPIEPGRSPLDYKGTDTLVRGLGLFVKRHPGAPIEVRVVRKGMHVAQTEQLVRDEGLGGVVTWLEEMPLRDFYRELAQADIVFEQFDEGAVGMTGLDAMALGKPLVANGRPEIFTRAIGQPLPLCQAATPEEVCAQLERLVPDAAARSAVGLLARRYVERAMMPRFFAEKCVRILSGNEVAG